MIFGENLFFVLQNKGEIDNITRTPYPSLPIDVSFDTIFDFFSPDVKMAERKGCIGVYLEITFIGHGSLMFDYGGKIIQLDPVNKLTDYYRFPPPDIILITHHHSDHLDISALDKIRSQKTRIILTDRASGRVIGGKVMNNGDVRIEQGIRIEAVPAKR